MNEGAPAPQLHRFAMKKIVFVILALLPLAAAAQGVRPEFNPNVLVPDACFADTQTFGGPEGIQRFLESKGSVLANTSYDFLAKLSEPADPAVKRALDDPQPDIGRLRTAAELIWDASRASGLNPQIILATLHKEQGLVGSVDADRLQKALDRAMGFDCPDSAGCGDLFPGFYYQLFGNVDTQGNRYLGAAKSLMRSFSTPGGRGPAVAGAPARVGQAVTVNNTLGGYDGIPAQQTVVLGNLATAALYRYTPHVFNGNYNFWKYFTTWFKYPNGALLRSTADQAVYIINDGELQRVPPFVAVARGLHLSSAMAASPTELAGYPTGAAYTPADNTVVSVGGSFYVFVDGVKHPASSFVLTQRKLNPALIMPVTAADAALFVDGPQLTPSDGTVIRGQGDSVVYLVDRGVLRRFSDFTLRQYAAAKLVQEVPAGEVPIYPKQGYVAPKNGTVIKGPSTPDIYVVSEARRLPLTQELFKNRRYRSSDVVTLTTGAELASIPLGPPATPSDRTWFAAGKELYLFKSGAKHPIIPFVARQRGITPDYFFEASVASSWPDGIAVPPKDGTLIKGEGSSTVYVVRNGQLRPLTAEIFKLWKFKTRNIAAVSEADVDLLAKDGYAEPPESTYFSVAGSGEFYVFKGGAKHRIYPFVAKQRYMTPDVTFAAEVAADWTAGDPIAPRNGSLLKGDGSSTVYLVSSGALRPLTDAAFKRRGYSLKKVLTVPQADLDGFAKGAIIER